jgi:hypothetical protein
MCRQCAGIRPLNSVSGRQIRPACCCLLLCMMGLHVHLRLRLQDEMLFYRDMSGESLHHRGYRTAMHRASLNEAAAAGILLLSGWPAVAEQNPGGPVAMSRSCAGSPVRPFCLLASSLARPEHAVHMSVLAESASA